MPDKPRWLDRLPDALASLERSPLPWVDRQTVEELLGVRRRRAQQILALLATQRNGRMVLVERKVLVQYLRQLAGGEAAGYEQQRQRRLWRELAQERLRWSQAPPVFVEIPQQMLEPVYRNDLAGLPTGVELAPGRITVTFSSPEEALQKLLALALATGQNREAFDELVQTEQSC